MVSSFLDNMAEVYKNTHLIISRAGASSVTEFAVAGIPSILVPLPSSSDNHQLYNAQEFELNKAGIVIEQKDFTAIKLSNAISELMQNNIRLTQMSKNTKKFAISDAAARLATQIKKNIINKQQN